MSTKLPQSVPMRITSIGTGNITSTMGSFMLTMNNLAYTATATTQIINNFNIAYPKAKPSRKRGWNSKHQVRCRDCARFTKVRDQRTTKGGNTRWIVDCKRCGRGYGFIGKRF